MTRLYCLECNTVVGESATAGHGDRDHGVGVCQTCAQHGRPWVGVPDTWTDARVGGGDLAGPHPTPGGR